MPRPHLHAPSRAASRQVQRWIGRARRGDQLAIEALALHFEPTLRRFVEHQMGRGARRWSDPSDVVQIVLAAVMRDLERPGEELDEDSLRRRLCGVARWRICDQVRRHRDDFGDSHRGAAKELAAHQSTMGPVTVSDRQHWVHGLIDTLPPDQREVVRLRALKGLEFAQVAAHLGIAPDAARMRFRRAIEALRDKVKQRELDAG